MKRIFRGALLMLAVASLSIVGCSKKEEGKEAEKQASQQAQQMNVPEMPMHSNITVPENVQIVIPPDVNKKFKAVKLEITDKATNKAETLTVDIGSEIKIPNTNLTARIDGFLPSFNMDGPVITTRSLEPTNPAALVAITENGKEIFKGWLFTMFPSIHVFEHPQVKVLVTGFVQKS